MEKSIRKISFLMIVLTAVAAGHGFADGPWNLSTYQRLMAESGRKTSLTERDFAEMQARKPRYLQITEDYLKNLLGSADPAVMKAFSEVPREYFMYEYEKNVSLDRSNYEGDPHPWAIGYGSYISDYRAQAYMTQILKPKPHELSLEIGTGSGFQSAVLSRLVREAYTIEIITTLGEKVDRIFRPLGYGNVHAMVGDGFYGWPGAGEKFDIIIVTCAAPYVPPPLLDQLKKNGRMIIPIGQPYGTQFLYLFTKDGSGKVHSRKEVPTYFIPMTGRAQEPK